MNDIVIFHVGGWEGLYVNGKFHDEKDIFYIEDISDLVPINSLFEIWLTGNLNEDGNNFRDCPEFSNYKTVKDILEMFPAVVKRYSKLKEYFGE